MVEDRPMTGPRGVASAMDGHLREHIAPCGYKKNHLTRAMKITWTLASLVFIAVLQQSPPLTWAESAAIVAPQDKYALVLGVGHYEHWPVLPNAVTDAREIAFLLEHGGFKVTLLTDPTANQLKSAITTLTQEIGQGPDRSILFYYAGQGESHPMAGGQNAGHNIGWLIPRDCPRHEENPEEFAQKAVSTVQLREFSKQMNARQILMLMDTSLSADGFTIGKPALKLPGATTAQPVRQYLFAGGAHEPIPDRSTFAEYLIKGLTGEADAVKDDRITASELAVYLSQQMMRGASGQHLQYALHPDDALAKGDFILDRFQRPAQKSRLYVDTQPEGAEVRLMNVRQKFTQGVDLPPGKYQVAALAQGYRTQTKWVTLTAGRTFGLTLALEAATPKIVNALGMEMRWINAGSFYMGKAVNPEYFVDNEIPHTVTLSQGFYIQTTELTVHQFERFVAATHYQTDAERSGCWVVSADGPWRQQKESNWRQPPYLVKQKSTLAQMPVTCVSYNDAEAFTRWLSKKEGKPYRLPTEAQWEFACRAGTKSAFAYGECLTPKHANHAGAGPFFPKCAALNPAHPLAPMAAGQLKSNPWGLYDMHANVAEWCLDWYGAYPDAQVRDPQGPPAGVERVFRGGHFLNLANECRSARRQSFAPDQAASVIGFRVVMLP
jgi:formylglycine-generating enzyme required for sulfatase activity